MSGSSSNARALPDEPRALAHEALWLRYVASREPGVRAQLLDAHLGLVHHCANRLRALAPAGAPVGELVSAGTLGLVQALEHFDPGRGLAFSSFAVPRIRGAMLDEVRRQDWRPRSVRAHGRQIALARNGLERLNGREPSAEEMALKLGVPLTEYLRWVSDLDRGTLVSLDDTTVEVEEPLSLIEILADPEAKTVDADILHAQERAALHQAFAALPGQDRHVLSLYFYEDLTLREIGEVLDLSESRVSQIRTRALLRLRVSLEREGTAR